MFHSTVLHRAMTARLLHHVNAVQTAQISPTLCSPSHGVSRTLSSPSKPVLAGGVLTTAAFKSPKPFVKAAPFVYGAISTIENPPNKERRSGYSADFNMMTCTADSVGTRHKRAVPYHPNASRNRVDNGQKNYAPPSRCRKEMFLQSIANTPQHQYRTTAGVTQGPSRRPMPSRTGFTNGGVTAELSARLRRAVFS